MYKIALWSILSIVFFTGAALADTPASGTPKSVEAKVGTSPTTKSNASLPYTGEDLFRGIFFGKGPVAALLPEMWDQPSLTISGADTTRSGLALRLQQGADTLASIGKSTEAQVLHNMAVTIVDTTKVVNFVPFTQNDSSVAELVISDIQAKDPTFFTRFGGQIQSGNQLLVLAALQEGAGIVLQVMDPAHPGTAINVYLYTQIAVNKYGALVKYLAVYQIVNWVRYITIPVIAASPSNHLESDLLVQTITNHFNVNTHQAPALSETGTLLLLLGLVVIAVIYLFKRF